MHTELAKQVIIHIREGVMLGYIYTSLVINLYGPVISVSYNSRYESYGTIL
jgi:hypothetical protein